MTDTSPDLSPDDWRRIRDALPYMGRDLHHRSFAVTAERRELLWQEMDHCLTLADRLSDRWGIQPIRMFKRIEQVDRNQVELGHMARDPWRWHASRSSLKRALA